MLRLSNLKKGQRARIIDFSAPLNRPHGDNRELQELDQAALARMQDLGLTTGALVEVKHVALLGDPMAALIRGTLVGLRKEDASRIVVEEV